MKYEELEKLTAFTEAYHRYFLAIENLKNSFYKNSFSLKAIYRALRRENRNAPAIMIKAGLLQKPEKNGEYILSPAVFTLSQGEVSINRLISLIP